MSNGIAARRQTGLRPADYVMLASLAAPAAGGFLRAIAPAAEAAPAVDAELAARNLYSSLPSLVQSGGVGGSAVRDRALQSLMSALPNSGAATGGLTEAQLANWRNVEAFLRSENAASRTASADARAFRAVPAVPAPADLFAGVRPAAESMAIPANIGGVGLLR